MKAKFKVGDKVRILDGKEIKDYTGSWCIPTMTNYIGEIHTVKRVSDWCDGRISYSLDDNNYIWDERGLEAVKYEQKVIITTDGKTTTARMFDGKKLIKSAVAKCNPVDEFDFETGAKIAFDRLVERDGKVKPKELLKNGVFGKSKEWGWFVVINDILVFEKGGMTDIIYYDDNLCIYFGESDIETIEIIVKAVSFNDAKKERNVIWKRK